MVVYDVCSLYSLYIIGYYKLDTWILTVAKDTWLQMGIYIQ